MPLAWDAARGREGGFLGLVSEKFTFLFYLSFLKISAPTVQLNSISLSPRTGLLFIYNIKRFTSLNYLFLPLPPCLPASLVSLPSLFALLLSSALVQLEFSQTVISSPVKEFTAHPNVYNIQSHSSEYGSSRPSQQNSVIRSLLFGNKSSSLRLLKRFKPIYLH